MCILCLHGNANFVDNFTHGQYSNVVLFPVIISFVLIICSTYIRKKSQFCRELQQDGCIYFFFNQLVIFKTVLKC